jgi:hypothetical protein
MISSYIAMTSNKDFSKEEDKPFNEKEEEEEEEEEFDDEKDNSDQSTP